MIDGYIWEWGSVLLRWLHIVAAMAWIGSSFFFMHLDATLRAAPATPGGPSGHAWQVHGGGFYEMRKFTVAPERMPEEITWHKWQAYWTWISGFVLLVWIYYAQSQLYLIDPNVMALTSLEAGAIGVGSLAAGWLVYDGLCRSPLGRSDLLLGVAGFGYAVAASWAFAQVFSGRGAMIHTGALMATVMSGNVFLNIMPGQRKVIAALVAGDRPDPKYGKAAKQRSTHNNYITLPVVFLMISNHYPVFWANAAVIPLVVALVIVAGALIRHFYNLRHADRGASPWWTWFLAIIALWTAFWIAMASSPGGRERLGLTSVADAPAVLLAGMALPPPGVVEIVTTRCAMCHAAEPVFQGLQIAPKGVRLDEPARIAAQAAAIREQAVLTHAMPPNNLTGMTSGERHELAVWLRGESAR